MCILQIFAEAVCVLQHCARKCELFSLLLGDTNATLLYCMDGFFELSFVFGHGCAITFTCKFSYSRRLLDSSLDPSHYSNCNKASRRDNNCLSLLLLYRLDLPHLRPWTIFSYRRLSLGVNSSLN